MAKDTKQKSFFSAFLMLLAAFIWGTAFVAQSKGLENIGNFTFLAFRSYLACAALLPVSIISYIAEGKKAGNVAENGTAEKSSEKFFSKRLWLGSFICGVIVFTASAFQQTGIKYSGVGKSGFLTTLYILIVPLIGLLFKRKVRPTLWGCIGIALVGMYFLCVTDAGRINIGDIMLILCALGFSIHITVIDHFVKSVSGIRLSLLQFFFSAVFGTVMMLIFEKPDMAIIRESWFSLFYAGVMSSGAAFTLQIIAQKNLDPVITSLLMSLESVFAALAGAVFGERLSANEIIGCCLVFTAIIISQLPLELIAARFTKRKSAD